MRWAEWILRQILATSRPGPRRTLRLAVLPLEDRAVPHNGIDHGTEAPAEPEPPEVAVVKETPPAPPAAETVKEAPPAADIIKGEDVPPAEETNKGEATPPEPEPVPEEPNADLDLVLTTMVEEDVRRNEEGEEKPEVVADKPEEGEEKPEVVADKPTTEEMAEATDAEHAHESGPVETISAPDAEHAHESGPVETIATTTTTPKAPFPQIGDRIWNDQNGNGFQDAGEPGLAFIAVDLYQGDKRVGTTNTNGTGEFAFNRWNVTNGTADTADDGLKANTTYQIRVASDQSALSGLRPTAANQGSGNADELRDSDATVNAAGAVLDVAVGVDELYSHFDIGYSRAASIGNLVWHDSNNNGVKDRNEAGIPGVTVRLLDSTAANLVATTTTDDEGAYLFTGLVPGTYVVEVGSNNFQAGGVLAGTASSTGKPGAAGGPVEGSAIPGPDIKWTDGKDSGTMANGTVRSKAVTVGGDGPMEHRAVDFGFFHSTTIAGKVFVDQNANGRIDAEDTTGLAGITVRVAGPAGTFSVKTDDAGAYQFASLPAGAYTVMQVNQPDGYKNSTPNLATTSVAGGDSATINFGEARTVDLNVTEQASRRSVWAGRHLTLTYRVRNLGTLDATGVMLLAPMPGHYKYVSSEVTGSTTYDSANQRATIGSLAAGAEVIVKVRVKVTQIGSARLKATVQGLEAEDVVRNNSKSIVVATTPAGSAAGIVKAAAKSAGTNWMLASRH